VLGAEPSHSILPNSTTEHTLKQNFTTPHAGILWKSPERQLTHKLCTKDPRKEKKARSSFWSFAPPNERPPILTTIVAVAITGEEDDGPPSRQAPRERHSSEAAL
jgi:hypothetical protein